MNTDELMRRWAPGLLASAQTDQPPAQAPLDDTDDADGDDGDDTPKHTGVMVAFYPSAQQQQQLALDDGEDPEELHLTLAYLGQVGQEIPEDAEPSILDRVRTWAADVPPVPATLGGIGVFQQDPPVTYASVDAPLLPDVRHSLVQHLAANGTPVNTQHGYTPHITLAYADKRDATVPDMNMTFTHAVVAFAGHQTAIPLGGTGASYTPNPPVTPQTSGVVLAGGILGGGDIQTHDRPLTPAPTPAPAATEELARAFVTDVNGHTLISGPATAVTASLRDPSVEDIANEHMLWMHGRFVGAEQPNRNGALWSSGDLQMSQASVVGGPLNWLHEARHVIGSLTKTSFVDPRPTRTSAADATATATALPHLTATAGIWKWIYPDEAYVVNQASDLGQLWYSMECISKEVACAGPNGCGNKTTYAAYLSGAACEHVTQRASVRQFVNPVFLGGAVIVPPTRPGWAEADASVMRQAAGLAEAAFEQAGEPNVSTSDWEQMMAQLVRFSQK